MKYIISIVSILIISLLIIFINPFQTSSNLDNDKEENRKDEYQVLEHNKTKILYKKHMKPSLGLIQAYLEETLATNRIFLGEFDLEKLNLKLMDRHSFKKDKLNNEWIEGTYDNRNNTIEIPAEDSFKDILTVYNDSNFRYILKHEYNHYMVDLFSDKENINQTYLPLWFSEGFASFIADYNIYNHPILKKEDIISFSKLNNHYTWNKNNKIAYEQSKYLFYILVHENGKDVVKNIILNTKEKTFDEAFKDITGNNILYYENKLKDYAENDWSSFPFPNHIDINGKENIKEVKYKEIIIAGLKEYIDKNPSNDNAVEELEYIKGINN